MSSLRKAVLWLVAITTWMFVLSVGLAWFDFGYLDVGTVAAMGLLLLPLLGVAVGLLVWTDAHEPVQATQPATPAEHGGRVSANAAQIGGK